VWAAMRFGRSQKTTLTLNLTSHQVRPTFMRKERKSHSSCPAMTSAVETNYAN
jgi:hypothetical protein